MVLVPLVIAHILLPLLQPLHIKKEPGRRRVREGEGRGRRREGKEEGGGRGRKRKGEEGGTQGGKVGRLPPTIVSAHTQDAHKHTHTHQVSPFFSLCCNTACSS